ncbi:Ger(x)C family spore germination protein [Sporosarcina sp. 179-K 3D1 HS]|uniref:Ger(x)C family spore germination protein n=1 Tax=Sporosarcina sp. 179-K 3D1 HS TaxID=3232169 RepID=UPI0039A09D9E
MNRRIMLLLLLLLPALTSCWDMNEAERMLYINGIGIDYKDGQYELYAQIINFANIAKSEQPPPDGAQAEVGRASGMTLDEAIFKLYHSVDQKVYWGHLSYLVVSEEAMKQVKMSPVIDLFIRFRETRYQIWVYTTQDSIVDLLLVRPVVNKAIILSKLGDPENSYEQESFVMPLDFRKLIIGMNEPGHEAHIPLITIEENWTSIKETIKAPVLTGVGVVTPDGFKGYIKGENARGIQWMSNETKRGEVTIETDDGNHMNVVIDQVKVKIEPHIENGQARFDIDVSLGGNISNIVGDVTPRQIKEWVRKEVEKEIRTTFEEALKLNSDIYGLTEQLYRKDVKAWKRFEKKGRIELTADSIRKLDITVEKLKSNRKAYEETIER